MDAYKLAKGGMGMEGVKLATGPDGEVYYLAILDDRRVVSTYERGEDYAEGDAADILCSAEFDDNGEIERHLIATFSS